MEQGFEKGEYTVQLVPFPRLEEADVP